MYVCLFRDPYQGFDRNAVHGLVYELFTVSDMERFKIGLEVAAGGYFSQVVVESPDISKLLISRGSKLRQRLKICENFHAKYVKVADLFRRPPLPNNLSSFISIKFPPPCPPASRTRPKTGEE